MSLIHVKCNNNPQCYTVALVVQMFLGWTVSVVNTRAGLEIPALYAGLGRSEMLCASERFINWRQIRENRIQKGGS